MWDYGSLDKQQERDYIDAKMKMINKTMEITEVAMYMKIFFIDYISPVEQNYV